MDFLIVDLTHGGVIIANELANNLTNSKTLDLSNLTNLTNFKDNKIVINRNTSINVNRVFSFDIYNTYNPINSDSKLSDSIIPIKDILELDNYNINDLIIISPVHCNFKVSNKINNITNSYLTHHEAINLILYQKSPAANDIIEITGVKGKTSVVGILEKILKNNTLLILSSLGAKTVSNTSENIKNNNSNSNNQNDNEDDSDNDTTLNETILKKNISITPASIIETINLAKSKNKNIDTDIKFDIAIFESSLGGTGNASIGVLTNIAENYSIANNSKRASDAKRQIFNSKIVICEYETLNNYYNEYNTNRKENSIINTFSIDSNNANLITRGIDYGLDNTTIDIGFNNIKTINNKEISGNFTIKTFAIGKHHVSNVLAAVATALTLEIDTNEIKNNITNFKGLKGRSYKSIVVDSKTKTNINIIEEINPGINVKAIESSIEMLDGLKDHTIIIGGDYGITCEEIDEVNLSKFLNKMNKATRNIILVGELGKNINKKLDRELKYIENPINAKKEAIKLKKDILFIFRSNYSHLDKR